MRFWWGVAVGAGALYVIHHMKAGGLPKIGG